MPTRPSAATSSDDVRLPSLRGPGIFLGLGLPVGIWLVFQPLVWALVASVIERAVSIWIATPVAILGLLAIAGGFLLRRYRRAGTYRAALAAARREHPEDAVWGVKIDPMTTPVQRPWGDSRQLEWGILRLGPSGLQLTRAQGAVLLDVTSSEFDGSVVLSNGDEWWTPRLDDHWGRVVKNAEFFDAGGQELLPKR